MILALYLEAIMLTPPAASVHPAAIFKWGPQKG